MTVVEGAPLPPGELGRFAGSKAGLSCRRADRIVARVYVTVREARLWFDVLSPQVVVGEDGVTVRPTVIGVHGGPGSDSTSMAGVLAPLGSAAHTIRFDQRGHGRSGHGHHGDWTVESWADDVAGLVDALGLAGAVLLGASFGARVALTCAVRHPGVLGAVVCAYGGARLDDARTVEAFRRLGGDRAAQAAAGDPADPDASFQRWLEVCDAVPTTATATHRDRPASHR